MARISVNPPKMLSYRLTAQGFKDRCGLPAPNGSRG